MSSFLRHLLHGGAPRPRGEQAAPDVYYRPPGAVPGAAKQPPTDGPVGPRAPLQWRGLPARRPGVEQAPAIPDASVNPQWYAPPGLRPGATKQPQYENVPDYVEARQPARMPRYRIVDPYQVVVGLHATFHPQPAEQPHQRMPAPQVVPGPDGRTAGSGVSTHVSFPSPTSFAWHPTSLVAPRMKAPTPPQ